MTIINLDKTEELLQSSIELIEKSVETEERRFANRALRSTAVYRHTLTIDILSNLIGKNASKFIFIKVVYYYLI